MIWYRTAQEVFDSPLAQSGVRRQDTLTDRVLRATKLEDSIYRDLRQEDEELDRIEAQCAKQLRSFPALSRDIFQSFYALTPRKNETATLSVTAQKFNAELLKCAMGQDDYPTLKNICEGRELLSYEAAAEFTRRMAGELDALLAENGGEKGSLSTLEKLETARKEAKKTLEELMHRFQSGQQPDVRTEKALVAAANQVQGKQRQIDAVSKLIDTSIARQDTLIDQCVSGAMHHAKERAQETRDILGAWSDDPGDQSRSPVNLQLLEHVRQNPALREISKYLGRFREMLLLGKRNGYTYGRGETYSLELGHDLTRAITSELAMLATPQTLPLFLRKYQAGQIKQYRRREPVYKGMGDVICCLDESGSTKGDAAAWGKAVALTLLELAMERGRKFALIHFSGPSSVKTDLFLPGTFSAKDKVRAAETFLGGGTNFAAPLTEAVRLMAVQNFENADVVFITDGECELPEPAANWIAREQLARHFTITGILLDAMDHAMDFSLKPFCQKIYRTSELERDCIVQVLIEDRI